MERALAALPDHPVEVEHYLLLRGIVGIPGDAKGCVVARYLRRKLEAAGVDLRKQLLTVAGAVPW